MFMSDQDFDNWHGTVQAEAMYEAMKMFVKCPECHGLLMFWEGFKKDFTYYSRSVPEVGYWN
jgi:hypothetical protein